MSCEFLVFMTFQFDIVRVRKTENSIKFSGVQNLNGSKFSKSKNVQHIVCQLSQNHLKLFFDNMIH
jgi:hypothetical protein